MKIGAVFLENRAFCLFPCLKRTQSCLSGEEFRHVVAVKLCFEIFQ